VTFRWALLPALVVAGAASHAAEVVALSGIDVPFFSSKPSTFVRTGNGVFAAALLRFEAGSGNFETGILRAGASVTRQTGAFETRSDGSFWIAPFLYRIPLNAPFFHAAIGADYAFGAGSLKSHPGLQAALQASQDLGDDFGVVIDLRYREGLGTGFVANGQSSGFRMLMASLGFQKRLE